MAYSGCRFCGGRGCLACPAESAKDCERAFNHPILTAKLDADDKLSESDAEDIRQVIGTSEKAVKTGDSRMDIAINSFLVQMRRARSQEPSE